MTGDPDPLAPVLAAAMLAVLAAAIPPGYHLGRTPATAVAAWVADVNSSDLGRVRRAYGLSP